MSIPSPSDLPTSLTQNIRQALFLAVSQKKKSICMDVTYLREVTTKLYYSKSHDLGLSYKQGRVPAAAKTTIFALFSDTDIPPAHWTAEHGFPGTKT
ncbi:unnamed protein product [Somion occarium]|uniref:Transposase n=1 Tax=Somion occarium TaxID=3059160 RepID=A0ABP1CPY2_9APHY